MPFPILTFKILSMCEGNFSSKLVAELALNYLIYALLMAVAYYCLNWTLIVLLLGFII